MGRGRKRCVFNQLIAISADSSSFPQIASRGFTAIWFFNTNIDDSDDECQVTH